MWRTSTAGNVELNAVTVLQLSHLQLEIHILIHLMGQLFPCFKVFLLYVLTAVSNVKLNPKFKNFRRKYSAKCLKPEI